MNVFLKHAYGIFLQHTRTMYFCSSQQPQVNTPVSLQRIPCPRAQGGPAHCLPIPSALLYLFIPTACWTDNTQVSAEREIKTAPAIKKPIINKPPRVSSRSLTDARSFWGGFASARHGLCVESGYGGIMLTINALIPRGTFQGRMDSPRKFWDHARVRF